MSADLIARLRARREFFSRYYTQHPDQDCAEAADTIQAQADRIAELERANEVLRRIRQWDMLDASADGPFWKRVIDDALGQPPTTASSPAGVSNQVFGNPEYLALMNEPPPASPAGSVALPELPKPHDIPGFYDIAARQTVRYTGAQLIAFARQHEANLRAAGVPVNASTADEPNWAQDLFQKADWLDHISHDYPRDSFYLRQAAVMMRAGAKAVAASAQESICYSCCPRHMGQTFELPITYATTLRSVCPGCEKERARTASTNVTSKANEPSPGETQP